MENEKNISGISDNLADSILEHKEQESKITTTGILDGLKVAISISNNEDLESLGLSANHLKDVMIELARYLIVNGATLLYGGDLRNDGYTKLFSELSFQYKFLNDKTSRFHNYFPFPNSKELSLAVKAEFIKHQVTPIQLPIPNHLGAIDQEKQYSPFEITYDRYVFSECFSNMRSVMANDSNARILLGGKQSNYLGYLPGIIEEAYFSLKASNAIYLIGGFGGAAKSLCDIFLQETPKQMTDEYQYNSDFLLKFKEEYSSVSNTPMDYTEIIDFFNSYSLEQLSNLNGLTTDENLILFESQNIHEIIFLIIKGLKNISTK
ncbi:MAG TPA: hypothetical protein VKY37_00145 [Brumimicrobium sp.]|nr:hypothetical protein [Brumimicrobium sp.]